jgi:glycosidase
MPIQPIGASHRKGVLGSYYSVRDYTDVNPEFGDLADFKHLVRAAHARGMHVILDWVANHTAWDNPWVAQHPDWYKKDANGQISGFAFDNGTSIEHWDDVVGLDYRAPELREAMIRAMAFWVRETDIDGFRCDVAGMVPTLFWEEARARLERIKPLFMLAESDDPALQVRAFDMTYDWGLFDVLHRIAEGKADASALRDYYERPAKAFPSGAYRMTFTSDHDINSWQGSDRELWGDRLKPFAVLAATLPGMPLIYAGQESGLDKRLQFFERDPVDWKDYRLADFYGRLLQLKTDHPALANGNINNLKFLPAASDKVVLFERRSGRDRLLVAVNLTGERQIVTSEGELRGLVLGPWDWRIVTGP